MNNPALYRRAGSGQRRDSQNVISEYASILQQHSEGQHALLDVGCGSGDVLIEHIVPNLAHGFTKIVGIDISPAMVEYSKKSYPNLEGVEFREMDILIDQLPPEFLEEFDRVTCFFCLHWVMDHRKCFENIFKCLRPGGDCLFVCPGKNYIFEAYRYLSREPKWKDYVTDPTSISPPLLEHPRVAEEYTSLLEQAGFTDVKIGVKNNSFTYEGALSFKDNMKAFNLYQLPDTMYEEYFDALCDRFKAMGFAEPIPGSMDHKYTVEYKLLVMYARKGK